MTTLEVLTGFSGAAGGFLMGILCVIGTIYKLWPDLYAELRARAFEEGEDDENA